MHDEDCIAFLQWALPQLHMRWQGFRKVHAQVCKHLARRLQQLQLRHLNDYRAYLQNRPTEWACLDSMCQVTISRFQDGTQGDVDEADVGIPRWARTRAREVVDDAYAVSPRSEARHQVGADETGSAGNQDVHAEARVTG